MPVWKWVKGSWEIEAIRNGGSLDVKIRSNRLKDPVWLQIAAEGSSLRICDLTGTEFDSGVQGIGLGTLAFNTALEILKAELLPNQRISGDLSNTGDPSDAEEAERCAHGRAQFWRGFGFHLSPRGRYGQGAIEARLEELRPRSNPEMIMGELPRYIELSSFQRS